MDMTMVPTLRYPLSCTHHRMERSQRGPHVRMPCQPCALNRVPAGLFREAQSMPFQRFLNNITSNNRGLVTAGFAVPASFAYRNVENLRKRIRRTLRNASAEHDDAVKAIQAHVRAGYASGKPMCTARKPWKTMSVRTAEFKKDMHQVPIDLCDVLQVDEERRIVRAEPMVTMGDLTSFLVPRGFALAVQAEMDDLTLGGLCMGMGIATSSHREGCLFETVEAFEIVTADGERVRATRDSNVDLFRALPCSHGTLGFLVSVELRIVPVQSHVKLDYQPFHSIDAFCARLKELTASPDAPRFIEGLIFSRDSAVMLTGDYATLSRGTRVNRINDYYKPWFYSHVAQSLKTGATTEYIPARHYFHRHTPSVYFQLRDLIPFANTPWYRYLWAWMGAPKVSLLKLTTNRQLRRMAFENRVVQDIMVPIEDLAESVRLSDELFAIYPLWLGPVRVFDHGANEGLLRNPANGVASQIYVDLGIFGIPPSAEAGGYDRVPAARRLEEFVRERGGYQMLYADMSMTRAEFERMFEHRLYRDMRSKYAAERAFPEVYDKVIPESWLK